MDLVKITTEFARLESKAYENVTLKQGKTYLLPKSIVAWIEDLHLGYQVDGFLELPHLSPDALRFHYKAVKVLFLFDGGFGDAISLGVLLSAMKHKYNMEFDIGCNYHIWEEILTPLGFSGNWVPVPVELEKIGDYDYIQTRGDLFLNDTSGMTNKCILEELALSYNVDVGKHSIEYVIPEDIRKRTTLPETKQIRIGLNFDSKGTVKSYPKELQPILASKLLGAGFELFFLGCETPNLSGLNGSRSIHDFCGKTAVPELASLIRQMDLVIGVDSFIAHLSDILGVSTIVLLSVTGEGIFHWHRHVKCIRSQIDCTPCDEVCGPCPKGYDGCRAFFHQSITSAVIVHRVIKECARNLHLKINGLK